MQKSVSKAQGNEPSLLQLQSILLVLYNRKDLTKIIINGFANYFVKDSVFSVDLVFKEELNLLLEILKESTKTMKTTKNGI